MSAAERDDSCDNWLGLCSPFICLQRKERSIEEAWVNAKEVTMEPIKNGADSYDSLERLGTIFEGLFRLDSKVILLQSREAFVKSCLADSEQFNIKLVAKGHKDLDDLWEQISKEHTIDEGSLSEILSGLKLHPDVKLEDAVRTITYHFINKLSAIQHDLKDALREYGTYHNSTIDEFENMRRRFFNLTLCRTKGKNGIDFSVSKADFKFIVNSKNDQIIDLIFSLLDNSGEGYIDWGGFELNSGRILTAAREFL
ncbi:hypothetical protein BgAZ_100990 [Babesia gibsoni]|uniref:EF-hand domain-containing protein n=1 Tax=Babesia gibsoni TaxID=33632 RepID=A0AAD8UUR9_BABGI|nr:hypothetical protein BgAZ_100990 [Babesia gibsoni]